MLARPTTSSGEWRLRRSEGSGMLIGPSMVRGAMLAQPTGALLAGSVSTSDVITAIADSL